MRARTLLSTNYFSYYTVSMLDFHPDGTKIFPLDFFAILDSAQSKNLSFVLQCLVVQIKISLRIQKISDA